MPRSRHRHKARERAASAARSARAQARQLAEMFAPLSDDQMIEAEGYMLDAFTRKRDQLTVELVVLRARLAALPLPAPVNTAAWVEANDLDDEITHITDALGEIEHVLDAVHNRRQFATVPALALMVIKAGSRGLLADAERLGVEPDAEALAEARRREDLIAGWMMQRDALPARP